MDPHQIVEIRSRRNGEQQLSPVEGTQRRRVAAGRGFRRAVRRGGSAGIDLPGGLHLQVAIRIIDGEVRAVLPRCGKRVVVDGEPACEVKALAIATAERSRVFQAKRREIVQ